MQCTVFEQNVLGPYIFQKNYCTARTIIYMLKPPPSACTYSKSLAFVRHFQVLVDANAGVSSIPRVGCPKRAGLLSPTTEKEFA